MRTTVKAAATLIVTAILVAFAGVAGASASVQTDLITAVNQKRAGTQLIWDVTLAAAAQTHADKITSATHSGYARTGWITAENVAWAPNSDANTVVNAWAASPGHSANQLGSQYTHAGAGYSPAGGWVLILGAAVEAPTPTPVPTPTPTTPPVTPPVVNKDEEIIEIVQPYTITTEDSGTRQIESFPISNTDTKTSGIGSSLFVEKKNSQSTGILSKNATVTSTKPVTAASSSAAPAAAAFPEVKTTTPTKAAPSSSSKGTSVASVGSGSGTVAVPATSHVQGPSPALASVTGQQLVSIATGAQPAGTAALIAVLVLSALIGAAVRNVSRVGSIRR